MRLFWFSTLVAARSVIALPSEHKAADLLEKRATACPASGASFYIQALGGGPPAGKYLYNDFSLVPFYPDFRAKTTAKATPFFLDSQSRLSTSPPAATGGETPKAYLTGVGDPESYGDPPQIFNVGPKRKLKDNDIVGCTMVSSDVGCELQCAAQTSNGLSYDVEYVCNFVGEPYPKYSPAVGLAKNERKTECVGFQMLAVPV